MTQEVVKTWEGFKAEGTLLAISWDYAKQEVAETWVSNEPGTDLDTPGALWTRHWEAEYFSNRQHWKLSSLSMDHVKRITEMWHVRMISPPIPGLGNADAGALAHALPKSKARASPPSSSEKGATRTKPAKTLKRPASSLNQRATSSTVRSR
jgi:hypothetical protein